MIFGLFLISVGGLMLINPHKALAILRKAGSTPLINYGELIVRMIPAAAMIIAADESAYPEAFRLLGWFMIATSIVLMIIPRKWHHGYALKSADILKLTYLRFLAPLSMLFGGLIIYSFTIY